MRIRNASPTLYRAVLYRDDPETGDAAVEVRTVSEPSATAAEAIDRGRAYVAKLGWAQWTGEVEAGRMVPWIPEPGIELTEWESAEPPIRIYFGSGWDEAWS